MSIIMRNEILANLQYDLTAFWKRVFRTQREIRCLMVQLTRSRREVRSVSFPTDL